MWIIVVLVCSGVGLAATLRQFRFVHDYPTRLLLLAFWARLSVSALHEYTAKSLVAGFSIIALTTLGFTGLMLLACRRRDFQAPHFAIYLPLATIIVLSGLINRTFTGLVSELITWTVFAATLQVVRMAIAENGMDRAMRAVMAPFLTPLLLQLASIAMNKSIGSEENGSRGFIGGYIHESVFSRFVMTFLVVSMLIRWRGAWARLAFPLYAMASILVSNYRTTILAVLPIAAVGMGGQTLSAFRSRYRPALLLGAAAFAVVAAIVAIPLLPPRFAEIFIVVANIGDVIQPPGEFTHAEQRIFSGRWFIWSLYVSAYANGSPLQIFFGIGNDADDGRFHVSHAHNSFVQYLFEYGIMGCSYVMFIMLFNMIYCLKIADVQYRNTLISMHIGFMLLNLSTGGLNSIEGLQLYAIIVAATLAQAQRSPVVTRLPAPRFG